MLQARNTVIVSRPVPVPHDQPAGKQFPKKRHRRLGLKGMPFILVFGCFLFGLVIIAQYSSMVTLHYRLGQAEIKVEQLQEEYRQLEREAAQLGSLARIESIARVELGMREPESGQIRVLTASRKSDSPAGE